MTDKEKLKEIKNLAEAMYYAAQYLTTDASRLHKAMDEYHQFIIHEWRAEPVSEGLEEEIDNYVKRNGYDGLDSIEEVKYIANHFANWQKQQDQETIELAEDHAMLTGMEKMKEQMMAKTTDVTAHVDAGGYPYIPQMELYDYDKDIPLAKEGDKYKVVLIKEE